MLNNLAPVHCAARWLGKDVAETIIVNPFNSVHAAMEKRAGNFTKTSRQSSKLRNLFQGGIFCATCGGPMGIHQREDPQIIGYLFCTNVSRDQREAYGGPAVTFVI